MTTDLDLAKFGVRELDAKEMAEIDGGFPPAIYVAALAAGMAV